MKKSNIKKIIVVLACVLLAVILSGIIMITRRSKSQDTKEEITFEEISKEPESSQSQEGMTQEETEEETETITYPQPEYDFTTEEVNVAIEGLDREYTFVWVSDLHLVTDHEAGDGNGDARPEYLDAIDKRYEELAITEDGVHAEELWPEIVRFINCGDYDGAIFGGDMMDYANVKDNPTDVQQLHDALEAAVKRQLMSDVPYGVLLSGGLDSSITSAIAKKYAAKRIETNGKADAWWPQLHSFAIGLKDAPDLIAARKVADAIGTVHHEIHYTIQEGLDALRDVIYHIETYDVTTVRASTPMYLLARVIRSMGIKMVLSGEGADEVFGGYLYFHKAPNAQAFHEETLRKLSKLYLYDCLRANKSLCAWGVEGRVPFLDKEFLDVAMRLNPVAKMCPGTIIEKKILREAFSDSLPKEIAWRQKEQFSDGVGYGWIDTLKKITSESVTDKEMANAAKRFPINPPQNKEEYYYRSIFEEHFPSESAARSVPSIPSVACSTAEALAWDSAFKNMNEPSGRAIKDVHESAY